jgi:hypothetical protein
MELPVVRPVRGDEDATFTRRVLQVIRVTPASHADIGRTDDILAVTQKILPDRKVAGVIVEIPGEAQTEPEVPCRCNPVRLSVVGLDLRVDPSAIGEVMRETGIDLLEPEIVVAGDPQRSGPRSAGY